MKKQIGLGFTLVEMLIVIVIIGILAAAILPKITGHLARTRDLQRHMDLNALSTAISQYRASHGYFPNRGVPHTWVNEWGSIHIHDKQKMRQGGCQLRTDNMPNLSDLLSPYLSPIPQDPNKNQQIKIHLQPRYKYGGYDQIRGENWEGGCVYAPGQYMYQVIKKGEKGRGGAAVLIAKVETPDAANYVLYKKNNMYDYKGGLRSIYVHRMVNRKIVGAYGSEISEIKLCSSVEKGESPGWTMQANGEYHCTYTNEEQLYYVLKIED